AEELAVERGGLASSGLTLPACAGRVEYSLDEWTFYAGYHGRMTLHVGDDNSVDNYGMDWVALVESVGSEQLRAELTQPVPGAVFPYSSAMQIPLRAEVNSSGASTTVEFWWKPAGSAG